MLVRNPGGNLVRTHNRRRPAWEAFWALVGQGFFDGGSKKGLTQNAVPMSASISAISRFSSHWRVARRTRDCGARTRWQAAERRVETSPLSGRSRVGARTAMSTGEKTLGQGH